MIQNESSRWDAVRSRFPGAETGPYLDVSGRSLLFEDGRTALNAHLDALSAGAVDKAALFKAVENTRELFATLVRSTPDEICFTRNVTDGIAAFGASIEWKPGDSVVLCEALEHPANVYPWFGLSRKFGIRVKSVAPDRGALSLDRIVDAIDAATRVVAISAVSFAPGFTFPVAELGAECRRRGVLLLVDAAQAIGIASIDVQKWNADAVVASTQKGLMALYGQGFLFIRREIAETLKPAYLSRFGVEQEGNEADLGDPALDVYAPGARRFDVGNYNYPGIVTVAPAIRMLLELGQETVQDYVHGLAHGFTDQILDLGLPVFGGRPGPHSSQIVTVGADLGSGHDSTGDHDMLSLYEHLRANKVRLSIRRNLLRFSFHIYNNERDIDTVIRLVAEWVRHRGANAGALTRV
jgi:cysteine desulfurase/selenocysteine lyase